MQHIKRKAMIRNTVSFKNSLTRRIMKAGSQTHTHTHRPPQVRSNSIDYWNNNKASIIDSLVLSAYEIQAKSSNQGHYSVPGRSEQKTEQESSINHYFLQKNGPCFAAYGYISLSAYKKKKNLRRQMIIKNELAAGGGCQS